MKVTGLTLQENIHVSSKRENVINALECPQDSTVAILGPCSATFNTEMTILENQLIQEFEEEHRNSGLIALQRLPFWKPRTNPDDWHGIESTHPEEATQFIEALNRFGSNVAGETGLPRHVGRLSGAQVFSWIGSRNFGNIELTEQLMRHEIDIPIGIKNDTKGDVKGLLEFTKFVNMRNTRNAPPTVPIFRGGSLLNTPDKWGEAVKEISFKTRGRCIIDLAHGSEMVHDPDKNKSEEGQINAVIHLGKLLQAGNVVAGFMIETSDIQSPTDPVISFNRGLRCARLLLQAKKR